MNAELRHVSGGIPWASAGYRDNEQSPVLNLRVPVAFGGVYNIPLSIPESERLAAQLTALAAEVKAYAKQEAQLKKAAGDGR